VRLRFQTSRENIRRINECKSASASFVRFAELQIIDLAHIWTIAKPGQRQRVQNLLFEGGLEYSPESGLLNQSKSSLFYSLRSINIQNPNLVELSGIELEPYCGRPSPQAKS